jgi:hypothetical protein
LIWNNTLDRIIEFGRSDQFGLELVMAEDRITQRRKLRKKIVELKNTALAELECRGYEVRGKTPAEIRQILKRRPLKLKAQAAEQQITAHLVGTAK